jgi:hypothetical protein
MAGTPELRMALGKNLRRRISCQKNSRYYLKSKECRKNC